MTIFGVDLSHHQAGIDLGRVRAEGFEFVFARVGQAAGNRLNGERYGTVRDREWPRHRDEARRHGLLLAAYWYVGDRLPPDENAQLCAEWLGDATVPVLLDHEDGSGSVAHLRATYEAFRRRALRVPLVYLPRWYWSRVAESPLTDLPPLWSSRYVVGRGTATALYPGDDWTHWTGYGGNRIEVAQFTNQATVAGRLVDANAYRGTRQQLAALLGSEGSDDDVVDWNVEYTFSRTSYKTTFGNWVGYTNQYAADAARDAAVVRAQLAALTDTLDDRYATLVAALQRIEDAVDDEDAVVTPEQLEQLRAALVATVREGDLVDQFVDGLRDRLTVTDSEPESPSGT